MPPLGLVDRAQQRESGDLPLEVVEEATTDDVGCEDAEQALGVLPSGPDRATGGETGEPNARESLQGALAPDELLLEYVLDEDSSTGLVTGKNVFRAVPLARGQQR